MATPLSGEKERELTSLKQDVLLHLVAHRAHQERFEVDGQTTELAILRVFRERGTYHVRRALQDLETMRYVTRKVQYAVGYNEPKPVFMLTTMGRLYAKRLLKGDGSEKI